MAALKPRTGDGPMDVQRDRADILVLIPLDHGTERLVFTLSEQRRASEAFYYSGRSEANFTAAPRRLRLGLELNF